MLAFEISDQKGVSVIKTLMNLNIRGSVAVKINKSCYTCEFNFSGKCASHGSDYEYGGEIIDFKKQRECWEIGLDYFSELVDSLPERQKQEVQRGIKSLSNFYAV